MQKQDWLMTWFGQGKVPTKQLNYIWNIWNILPQDEGLKSSFRNRTATGRDMVGTWWVNASMEHFWEAASCEIPPANEVAWSFFAITAFTHCISLPWSFQPWHRILQHAKWFKKGWHEAVTSFVMSSCWGSGSGKWSFNPSQSFNLSWFWKSLGFDVACGLIDKNGSLCFLYTMRNPWHPEFCSLGDVHVLLVFFFHLLPLQQNE